MNPLTRKADVLKVLQAGGYAVVPIAGQHPRIAYLFDATGGDAPAWQAAITSNLGKCTPGPEVVTAGGICREWRIGP